MKGKRKQTLQNYNLNSWTGDFIHFANSILCILENTDATVMQPKFRRTLGNVKSLPGESCIVVVDRLSKEDPLELFFPAN